MIKLGWDDGEMKINDREPVEMLHPITHEPTGLPLDEGFPQITSGQYRNTTGEPIDGKNTRKLP